jgi:hypothetical protein
MSVNARASSRDDRRRRPLADLLRLVAQRLRLALAPEVVQHARATLERVGDRRVVGPGLSHDAARGLLVDGATVEQVTRGAAADGVRATLARVGIRPVTKRLWLDLDALLLDADPAGCVFAHDKVEGIALVDGGRRLVLSNDCDFGIAATSPPSARVAPKVVPTTGAPDFGELLVVDVARARRLLLDAALTPR